MSDINRKDCMNHSILDAGLIVYHTPHQLAVTTLPLPPRNRVRLTNTDSSGLELEVVVCTEVWNFRYIDRFLLDVHFTNRGGDTLDRPFKECFSHASIYLIGKPIICFVKIKIKPNCNISTNNNGLVDEVSVPEVERETVRMVWQERFELACQQCCSQANRRANGCKLYPHV